jgi:hypothetical protein
MLVIVLDTYADLQEEFLSYYLPAVEAGSETLEDFFYYLGDLFLSTLDDAEGTEQE